MNILKLEKIIFHKRKCYNFTATVASLWKACVPIFPLGERNQKFGQYSLSPGLELGAPGPGTRNQLHPYPSSVAFCTIPKNKISSLNLYVYVRDFVVTSILFKREGFTLLELLAVSSDDGCNIIGFSPIASSQEMLQSSLELLVKCFIFQENQNRQ